MLNDCKLILKVFESPGNRDGAAPALGIHHSSVFFSSCPRLKESFYVYSCLLVYHLSLPSKMLAPQRQGSCPPSWVPCPQILELRSPRDRCSPHNCRIWDTCPSSRTEKEILEQVSGQGVLGKGILGEILVLRREKNRSWKPNQT